MDPLLIRIRASERWNFFPMAAMGHSMWAFWLSDGEWEGDCFVVVPSTIVRFGTSARMGLVGSGRKQGGTVECTASQMDTGILVLADITICL